MVTLFQVPTDIDKTFFFIISVFLRKNKKSGKPEIVLLDHGLYETLPPPVRLSLCQFWEAIVLKDQAKMDKYAKELNVNGLFAHPGICDYK